MIKIDRGIFSVEEEALVREFGKKYGLKRMILKITEIKSHPTEYKLLVGNKVQLTSRRIMQEWSYHYNRNLLFIMSTGELVVSRNEWRMRSVRGYKVITKDLCTKIVDLDFIFRKKDGGLQESITVTPFYFKLVKDYLKSVYFYNKPASSNSFISEHLSKSIINQILSQLSTRKSILKIYDGERLQILDTPIKELLDKGEVIKERLYGEPSIISEHQIAEVITSIFNSVEEDLSSLSIKQISELPIFAKTVGEAIIEHYVSMEMGV